MLKTSDSIPMSYLLYIRIQDWIRNRKDYSGSNQDKKVLFPDPQYSVQSYTEAVDYELFIEIFVQTLN